MYYRVRRGEKISDIVNRFDVQFAHIKQYNDFVQREDEVHTGRTVTLPFRYTVLPEDTYDGVARKFSVSLDEFQQLNPEGMGRILYPGQTVMLPPVRYREVKRPEQQTVPLAREVIYIPVPVYPWYDS